MPGCNLGSRRAQRVEREVFGGRYYESRGNNGFKYDLIKVLALMLPMLYEISQISYGIWNKILEAGHNCNKNYFAKLSILIHFEYPSHLL